MWRSHQANARSPALRLARTAGLSQAARAVAQRGGALPAGERPLHAIAGAPSA